MLNRLKLTWTMAIIPHLQHPITQQATTQPTPSNDHLPSTITSPSNSANFQCCRTSVGWDIITTIKPSNSCSSPHDNHPSPVWLLWPSSRWIYEWPSWWSCHLHLSSAAATTKWIERCSCSAISLTCGFDTSTAARVDTVTAAPIDIVSMSFWWCLMYYLELHCIHFTTCAEV
jgi:hypothetical protein